MKRIALEAPEWLAKNAVYQINPRTFSPEGTLEAVTRELPRLRELGFYIMYLCPIFEADPSEDRANWSTRQKKYGTENPKNPYRMNDYFRIDEEYGSMEDLRAFIAAAHALGDLPVVFAKKSAAANQSGDMAQASVYSFTHKCENHILVDRRYIPIGSRVLIVDDFLADGNAVRGMMDIVRQLGGKTVGVGIAVEKGFQDGGKTLRAMGVNLMSLAIVTGIEDGKILLAEDDSI